MEPARDQLPIATSDAQGQRGLIRVSAAVMPALAVKLARTA
jgi:hypothetical protein